MRSDLPSRSAAGRHFRQRAATACVVGSTSDFTFTISNVWPTCTPALEPMLMMMLLPSTAAICPVSAACHRARVKAAGIDCGGDLRGLVVNEMAHVAVDELLVAIRARHVARESAGVPGRARARLLVGEALNDLAGLRVDHAHRDFDRHAMGRDAAGSRSKDAGQ